MTQDEIIRMAREAGFIINDGCTHANALSYSRKCFERFAALVAAREREKQAEQEPVAWITPDGEGWRMRFDPPVNDVPLGWTPLYAAPVRTKDLTDDEIMNLVRDECVDMRWPSTPLFIARAVIAADREKNK